MSNEAVRDEVLQTLTRNFFGPAGGPAETFTAVDRETPVTRYMTGILFPSDTTLPPAEDDGGLGSESKQPAGEDEARLSMCNAPNPSSYGLSFACRPDARTLRISVGCGIYSLERDPSGKPLRWMRRDFSETKRVTVLSERKVVPIKLNAPGLELRVTFRAPDKFGALPITATLVNAHSPSGVRWEELSTICFFQCSMSVNGEDGQPPFVERRARDTRNLEKEIRHALLLYRHAKLYAVGHGCAADWDPKIEDRPPDTVSVSFIPVKDVYPLVAPQDPGVPDLPLARLAKEDFKTTAGRLGKIADAYEKWVNAREGAVAAMSDEFRDVAEDQLKGCRASIQRIRKGVDALADPMVFHAFQLSQQAMLEVFARSAWLKDHNCDPAHPPTHGDNHVWRPFQMAFLLQALESLVNVGSKDRDICDLLWFPTGGGKTEAYLGLTALELFLRRLRAPAGGAAPGGGTAVLMRYTLRLLTADQFARAAMMICAAEHVRRREPKLKNTAPITIGLWVGDGATPNSLKAAAAALKALHAGETLAADQSSPIKLKRCPWCGTGLGKADHRMTPDGLGVAIRCRNTKDCDFHTGIPAVTVDEQVYSDRPSLVIGTADKFARLPWEQRAGALFSTDGLHPPPGLIIQDELHLISGPLGTIAGLYEAAVDQLCTRNGIVPKLVASTATIRNAESQVRRLFARRFAQFPQPLLDARDSFFARESREKPARRFAGLFTPGKTPLTAFIRMTGSLGHATFASNAPDADKDPYWTQMSYFNSLRELGSAVARVHDDVADYMKTCATLDGTAPAFREFQAVEELTSRTDQQTLDEVRDRLWERKGKGDPFDMVLCSNMISVGLDVPRLGLMAVVGQPKTTAEYIQASSRIGRFHPGLVVTLYNWTRSRDRSHYERFVPYHSRLYAEVEATSVTPYSSRARDRALHAVLIAVARHTVAGLAPNGGAALFKSAAAAEAAAIQLLRDRINRIETDPKDRQAALDHLDRIAALWERMATAARGTLTYRDPTDPDKSLLVPFEDHTGAQPGFPTMNNMRNVDPPAGVYLL